jgi:hypothetical protein
MQSDRYLSKFRTTVLYQLRSRRWHVPRHWRNFPPGNGAKILRDYVPTKLEVGAFPCHTRETPRSPTEYSVQNFLSWNSTINFKWFTIKLTFMTISFKGKRTYLFHGNIFVFTKEFNVTENLYWNKSSIKNRRYHTSEKTNWTPRNKSVCRL